MSVVITFSSFDKESSKRAVFMNSFRTSCLGIPEKVSRMFPLLIRKTAGMLFILRPLEI
jgi:hypothetical protein